MTGNRKPILCLDFDGVIHSYVSGWQGVGVANDPPVDGLVEFLIEATARFRVCVHSSRSRSLRGRWVMRRYLREHCRVPLTFSPDHEHDWLDEAISFPWFKPPAMISIDDRAITFTGVFPPVEDLLGFKTWTQAIKGKL